MWCGRTKLLFDWRYITIFAVVRTGRSLVTTLNQTPSWSSFLGRNKLERPHWNMHFWGDHECWDVYRYSSTVPGAIHSMCVPWWSSFYARQRPQAHLTSCPCILCWVHQLVEDAPESPDANPIENLWHELKVFLLCVACHSIVPSQQHPSPLYSTVCVHNNTRKLKSRFSASVYYYEWLKHAWSLWHGP